MKKITKTAERFYNGILENPVKAVKITAVVAMLCMCIAYIAYMCTYTAVTVAYADGVRIGTVNSADVFAPVMQASNDARLITYPPAKTPDITFEVCLERNTDTLSQKQIYEKVYGIATEGYKEAYALYIDGEFAAANENSDTLRQITSTIADGIQAQNGDGVEITSDIEVKKIYCAGEYVHGADRILSSLANGLSYTVDIEGDADIFEFFFEEDADKSFAPNISSSNNSASISTNIDEQVKTKYITVTEEIPYITVYEKTQDHYEGVYIKKNDGENGCKTVTYEIKYENGKEVMRTPIEEKVIAQATDKVVYMGIKVRPSTASTGDFIWPLNKGDYIITSHFGYREFDGTSDYHKALDLAADRGTDIFAADGGKVITVSYNHRSYGIYVVVQHDDGKRTLYAHMSACSVSVGDKVYQGQKIGEVGSTGYSTGDHLHFEVIVNGIQVDPEKYLPKR